MSKAMLVAAMLMLAACAPAAEEGVEAEAPADAPAMTPEAPPADSMAAPADTMARDTSPM